MSQAETILALLREGPKSLRQIAAHPSGVFYEFRSRTSELRSKGYVITHHKVRRCKACLGIANCPAKRIGEDVYTLDADPATVEPSGQLVFAP